MSPFNPMQTAIEKQDSVPAEEPTRKQEISFMAGKCRNRNFSLTSAYECLT